MCKFTAQLRTKSMKVIRPVTWEQRSAMTEQWFTGPGTTTPLGLVRHGMDRRRPGDGVLMIAGPPGGVGASTTDLVGAGASVVIRRTHGGEGGRIAGAPFTTAA